MWKIISLAILQSALLALGQVFLKLAQMRMIPFSWTKSYWCSVFLNWRFALCGLLFGTAGILWMYIVKCFPLSTAYPMVSLSYVFGIFAATMVFHETVGVTKWLGVAMIILGCFCIAR